MSTTQDTDHPDSRHKDRDRRVAALTHQADALRLLRETAHAMAETVEARIDAEDGRPETATHGRLQQTLDRLAREAADRVASRSTLDRDQVLRLTESLLLTAAGAINATDGWIAVAAPDAPTRCNCHCRVAPGLHEWNPTRPDGRCPETGPVPA